MSWLDLYVGYAKNNEAAERLHWWSGLTILGASLRRNVSFSQGYYRVFPAIWTMIVSPSGTKKTTAVQIAYNIVSKLEHVRILADKSSPEALALSLSEKEEDQAEVESQGLIYAPELANFMDKRTHNEGLVQLLLRMADTPNKWDYRTKMGGFTRLRNVAVSILAATADDLLYECIPPLALKSGFLARFLCISGHATTGAVPFPWKDGKLEIEVLNGLYELSLLHGEMVLGKKAQEWYVAWYFRHKAMAGKLVDDKIRAYYERKPDHLLRVAMLLSISKHKRLEYTIDAFEECVERLDDLELGLLRIYREIDISPTGKAQTNILKQLEVAGGWLYHEDLIAKNFATEDTTNYKKLLGSLIEAHLIKIEKINGKIAYRRIKHGEMEGRG